MIIIPHHIPAYATHTGMAGCSKRRDGLQLITAWIEGHECGTIQQTNRLDNLMKRTGQFTWQFDKIVDIKSDAMLTQLTWTPARLTQQVQCHRCVVPLLLLLRVLLPWMDR